MKQAAVRILKKETLSDNWYHLYKYTYQLGDGPDAIIQTREVYDRGNGATILLYDTARQTVVLTRQLRIPTYVNGNTDGMMIEACAGLLDEEDAESCIRREVEEETGFRVGAVSKVFEAYMSPGSVTEVLHFFVAPYTPAHRVSEGGGIAEEQENIQVLELPFARVLEMVGKGEIKDAKTILLVQHLQLQGWMSPE